MISIFRIIKSFQEKEAFDYSSVQCDMPSDLAEEVIAWGKKNIPDEDLAGNGREDNIHVTLKYGLHDHDPFELREMLADFGPVDITLGETSIFENDEADVVKLSVVSPRLCKLNTLISDKFEHTDTHDIYIPHVTLAYVKPGYGKKYQGRKDFSGRKIKLEKALFSGNDNRKTELPLTLN
jgi:2'-5' RNA ligase